MNYKKKNILYSIHTSLDKNSSIVNDFLVGLLLEIGCAKDGISESAKSTISFADLAPL